MTAEPQPQLFRCEPYNAKISTRACGRRYKAARRKRGRVKGQTLVNTHSFCADCPIGRAHAAGETPAVELVQINEPRRRHTA